tara:strand:+ start:2764 stop:3900 length:1137 start_codon:yes stop_codon:yes gene_type:complete
MKKKIYHNFLKETSIFFLISSFAVTIIVWVIQAVNYLEFVTEDGHSFKIYFYYTLLSLPKIFNKLLPFMFFFSIFFNLLKYEEQNQTLIFWTNGISKIKFLNVILKFSIIFFIINFVLSLYVVPSSQDKARSFIRQSNIDYLPFLIKPKKFIDTVEQLTIYSDKRKDGILENILIKDKFSLEKSKIIYANKGYFTNFDEKNFLVLEDGKILNINKDKTNSFDFKQTQINLSKYATKTTTMPKIQEVSTLNLASCLVKSNNIFQSKTDKKNDEFKCNKDEEFKNNISEELSSRIFKPFYIPLLALIGGLLLIKSKNSHGYTNFKLKIFIIAIIFISVSEISAKFYSTNLKESTLIFLIPFFAFCFFYNYFNKKSKGRII